MNDYVPIPNRVRVEPLLTVSDAMLKVYTGNMGAGDGWALLCTPNCVGHAENMAEPIRATIRLACEDMRERCAEVARERAVMHIEVARKQGWSERREAYRAEAKAIAAAIQGLEL